MYSAAGDDGSGSATAEPMELELGDYAGSNETIHFVDCILNGGTPWSTLDDAVQTMRLCEAVRRGHKGELE